MTNIITKAWDAFVVRVLIPDMDAIIRAFLKVQSKLVAFIEREEAKLANEAKAIAAAVERQALRNTTINRAYRVIHRLDQLTA